ncbi:MAG: AAA family ATPase [Candidatus Thorarchaeota archaeon]
MKLLKLEVRNFKPFRELVLPPDDVEFPEGLIIIKGPNSTGKSSLFESILWSLWGPDSVSGLSNDELVSFSSTFCRVILQFEVAGARYKIDRTYNPADGMAVVLFMLQDKAWKRIADKSTSVARKLDGILCLELKQALNTLMVRQGEVAEIANAKAVVLRNRLVDIYDIDILKGMSKHLDNFESNLGDKINALSQDYRPPEDIQEQVTQCLDRITEFNESVKKRNDETTSTEKKLEDIPDTASLRKISEITHKLDQDNRDFIRRSQELQDDLSKAGLLDADDTLVKARLDSLEKVKERSETERNEIDTLKQTTDQEIGQITSTNQDLEEKISTLKESSGDQNDSICPTCSKPLSPKERDNLIVEYMAEIKSGTAKLKVIQKERNQHVSSTKKIEERLREISTSRDATIKAQETKKQVDSIQSEISPSEENLSKILGDAGVSDLDALLKKFKVSSVSDLQTRVAMFETTLKEAKKGTQEIEERIRREELLISDLKGKEILMKQMGLEIEEMKRLNEHAKYVRRKLVSGFVADYVFQKRLIGIIRSATNQYVRFFTNGQYTSIDLEPTPPTKRSGPGLILKIWDERDQAWKKTGQLSYGDRTAISLGLRLGISRTMSSIRPLRDSPVITPRVRSVLLDEPLGGLDKMRREAVVTNLVNDKNFEQIFLITHTDVQGWDDVPSIEVAKDGSSSTATLEM